MFWGCQQTESVFDSVRVQNPDMMPLTFSGSESQAVQIACRPSTALHTQSAQQRWCDCDDGGAHECHSRGPDGLLIRWFPSLRSRCVLCAILGFASNVDQAQHVFSCFSTIFTAICAWTPAARGNAVFSCIQSTCKRVRVCLQHLVTSLQSNSGRIAIKKTASGRHGRHRIGRC